MRTKLAVALGLTLILVLAGSVVASAADFQPSPTAPIFYTVRPGDSLSSIAKAQLGSTARWRELYQMNRSIIGNDPNHLVVGEVLTLVKGTLRSRRKPTAAGPELSNSGPVLIDAQASGHIKHVFVIMQENHTFDNYFGTYPGVDGIPTTVNMPIDPAAKAGPVAQPYHLPSLRTQDLDHSQISAEVAYNGGRMNGFVAAQQDRNLPGSLALGYYDRTDLPLYWDLADNYVLADRFFSSAMGGSLANHQYWVAAKDSGVGESIPVNGIQMTTIFDRLARLDPKTGAQVARIALPANLGANGLAVNSKGLWVVAWGDTPVMRVDPATNTASVVARFPGGFAQSIAADEDYVWTTHVHSPSPLDLARIDAADPTTTTSTHIPTADVAVGDGEVWFFGWEPGEKAASPRNHHGLVGQVDPVTLKVLHVADLPVAPFDDTSLVVADHAAWVVDSTQATVWRVDDK